MSFPGLDNVLAVHLGAARFTVLGYALRPYSLFHRELLRLAAHPLVAGDREPTLMDLELAARLLSLTPREAAAELARKVGAWERWGRTLGALWRRWRGHDAEAVFRAYFESCNGPAPDDLLIAPSDGAAGAAIAVPDLLDMILQLGELGIGFETAGGEWPHGLVQWVFLTHLAKKTSQVGFVTDEHRKAVAEIKADEERERLRAEREQLRNTTEGPPAQRFLKRILG
jgi:hypothetical protein